MLCLVLNPTLISLVIDNLFKGSNKNIKLERFKLWQLDNS